MKPFGSDVFIFIMCLLIIFLLVLLQVYKLPKDRIYATYFGGDEKGGLAPDNEARDLWLKFLPPGCVLPFGCKVCPLWDLNLWFHSSLLCPILSVGLFAQLSWFHMSVCMEECFFPLYACIWWHELISIDGCCMFKLMILVICFTSSKILCFFLDRLLLQWH